DDFRDIPGKVMQADIFHWSPAAPDPARLWAQHAVAGVRKTARHRIVIIRVARERWKEDDGRTVAINDDFDLGVPVLHEFADMLRGGLAGWQRDHEPKQGRQHFE